MSFAEVAGPITKSGMYTVTQGKTRQIVSGTDGGSWNPDRSRATFLAPADDTVSADLCVLEVGARSVQRVATVSWPGGVTYAPGANELWAGSQIVVNDDAVTDSLLAIDAASGTKTKITDPNPFDVSPDGTRVAILEPMDRADRHLRIHDLLHGTTRDLPITPRAQAPYGIQWIDNDTVVFGNEALVTKDVKTGAESEVVAAGTTPLLSWAYSTTNRQFAYVLRSTRAEEDEGLYTINREGSGRQFIRSARTLTTYTWSPDGLSLLAVHGNVRDRQTLHLETLDGTSSTMIASASQSGAFRIRDGWSPDGSTIEFSFSAIHFG